MWYGRFTCRSQKIRNFKRYHLFQFLSSSTFTAPAKIGGWMSLAIGGSAISVLELVAFLGFLGWAMVNKLARTMAKM